MVLLLAVAVLRKAGRLKEFHVLSQAHTQEISEARIFENPLVPVGADPEVHENASLAAALQGYAKRSGPDDFSSLIDFIDAPPADRAWSGPVVFRMNEL
jgi:hypothetical protein